VTPTWHKVGLLVIRDGCVLLCRKKTGTQLLILPGGCIEPGESHLDCLRREIVEELGAVTLSSARYLSTYDSDAAGGGTVRIELYEGSLIGELQASAEIAELIWFSPHEDRRILAPSIRDLILPDVIARGLLR
jgi:8-oxo-dGTP pyrophosphatase MutT (NUDIX family)